MYSSKRFGDACRRWGGWQSMGRVAVDGAGGSCFDNAVSKAFNRVLKVEHVHWQHFPSRAETRIKIGTWIADFYNTRRMHSGCRLLSPVGLERQYWVEQVLQEAE
ncbi:integrase core domain-containing protein [Streptomyces sp. A30]|uniref:integrase core domain-containing protein n=1 Tax=Streptomyces sp. A30 TaxID=2789273 RepID=UPI003980BC46